MKYRAGYVSNSSSSSFVLDTHFLSAYMISQISNHIKVAQDEYVKQGKSFSQFDKFGYANDGDGWSIKHIDKDKIALYTSMDNFDMEYFLNFIGVPKEAILESDEDGWKYIE